MHYNGQLYTGADMYTHTKKNKKKYLKNKKNNTKNKKKIYNIYIVYIYIPGLYSMKQN